VRPLTKGDVRVAPTNVAPRVAASVASRRRAHSGQRLTAVAAVVLLAICVAPIIASGIDAAGQHWQPAGDWSVLELRTRDVGSDSTPLVGPYSRYGWNHPGPLLFWVFSVPYRILGQSSSSMLLTAALVNVASVAALGWFAWRRGRLPLVAATAAGTALLCTHLGPSFLRDPWNPSITVLPFAVFLVLAWSAWEGDRVALAAMALTGSFLVQSHVGFAAMVIVMWAVGATGYWRRRDASRRALWWAGAVLVVCWLPVLVDQLAGSGNIGELLGYFGGGTDEPAAGWSNAAGVIARELGGVGPWLGGAERGNSVDGGLVTGPLVSLLIPLSAFVGALALASARRASSAVRFQIVVATATLVGLVSVVRITGPVYAYLVRWLWVLALLWWLSIFWSLWSALFAGDRRERRVVTWPAARTAAVVGVVAIALVVVARTAERTASGIDRIGRPDGEWYVTLDEIVDDVVERTPRDGPVLVRAVGSNNGSIADALRLQLDRNDFPVLVDQGQVHKYGRPRSAVFHSPELVMTVATGSALTGPYDGSFGTVIASWDPLEPAERAFADMLEDRLADQLSLVGRNDLVTALRTGGSLDEARALDGVQQDVLAAVEQYRRQGDPVTVYLDTTATTSVVPGRETSRQLGAVSADGT